MEPGPHAASSTTIYVPSGYAIDTSKPAGTELGAVKLSFYVGTTPVAGDGDLIVADRSLHVADPCSPGLHAAVWVVQAYVRTYFFDGCHPALGAAPCTLETISPPPDAARKVVVRR